MRSHVTRVTLAVLGLVAVALAAGTLAMAVSQSDVAYRDGYLDLSGLDATRTRNVAIDALGGLRLVTNGPVTPAVWTKTADFTAPATPLGPLVGYSTLDATKTADRLQLLSAPFAFRRAQATPVLSPVAPLSVDGFSVGGMCVQRISGDGGKYYMWYTGVPENEYAQRIYLATSSDGLTWAKEPTPVLGLGDPGAFDSRQLGKPTVIYDPANVAAPFRMWYGGEGDRGGSIGYATSLDGRTWVKYIAPGATQPAPVLPPGKIGTADSYRVMHPNVLIDNGVYFMWYTADDSNNRRVAYATSTDGLAWDRGGVVFDVGTGNYSEGAFAPAVVRTIDGFHMIFTGNKIVAGTEIQSKLINADSADGLTWAAGNIAFSAAGGSTAFDGYNVSQPAVLSDPADTTHPYKMWYVGNNPDDNGNFHDRVGLAYQKSPSTVSQWEKVPGTATAPYYDSWLALGEQGPAFDSMKVADLRPVLMPAAAGTGIYGFYTGTNAADFVDRIGVQQSADGGLTWADANAHAALIGPGPVGTFDVGGVACPAPLEIGGDTGWYVFHTATSETGAATIGLHTVSSDLATVTRTATAPVVTAGTTFDSGGQADPWAVRDGTALGLFYAGEDTLGVWSIGLSTSPTGDPMTLGSGRQLLAPTPGGYDAGGLRKPVAHKAPDGSWRLFYTAIDAFGVKRVAYATAPADAGTWTKQGLVLTPSTAAYDFAEVGVEPSSAGAVGGADEGLFVTGTDRFGWTRIGKLTAAGPGYLDGGSATYELVNATARDWRKIVWAPATVPAETTREVWVSYYPTYSGDWSDFFPVPGNVDLPFLLTVEGMRWQVRMTSTAATTTPKLDDLTVNHAPVRFPASGTAVTNPIGPPEGLYLLTWGDLTLAADQPGATGITVEVQDDAGAQVVPPQTVTGGALTVPLAGVAPLGSKLVAVCTLTGDTLSTPKLKSLTVTYTTTVVPSQLTLTSDKALLLYGGAANLSGVLSSDPTPLDATDGNTVLLAGQTVTIKAHVAGTVGYTTLGTATTGADGSFTFPTVKPMATTTYRAEWAGGLVAPATDPYPPATGAVTVQVKPKLTLAVTKYNKRVGKYYLYKLGRTVYVKGAMTPNHSKLGDGVTAGKVTVTVYKYRSTTRKWVKVKASTRTLTLASAYSWTYKPSAKGTYRLITRFAGDVDHVATASVYRYVKIY